jgi:hypothetical protein
VFFAPNPSHAAQLLLPPLPPALEIKYGTLGQSNAMVIALYLAPGLETGVVNLLGDDRAALDKLWATIVAEGGIGLLRRDDRSYWDLHLATSPQGVPGADGRWMNQYVYAFDGGRLVSASASGTGVDLLFEAVGSDDIRCETPAPASYSEGLVAACRSGARTTPA